MHDKLFQTLKNEHDEVQNFLAQLKGTSDARKRDDLFMKLQHSLVPHMKGEEKAFYPVLTENDESREHAFEALEEHHVAELVLNELMKMPKSDEHWGAKLSVFKELIDHHIEEEESEIFDDVSSFISEEKSDQIFSSYKQERDKVMAGMKEGAKAGPSKAAASGQVSLNSANEEELSKIRGIGPTMARHIIEYRNEHGAFKSWDDVDKITGITEVTIRSMKEENVTI